MHLALRQSFSAKITAIGFIALILFGNFWLSYQLLASSPAVWIQTGFWLSILLVIAGGCGLGIQAVFLPRIEPLEEEEETDNKDGNPSL